MDEVEKAKRIGTVIRGGTTRIFNKAKEELEEHQTDVEGLETLLVQLQEKEGLLKELDRTIENGIDDLKELESEVNTVQEYREKILNWKTRISRVLKRNDGSQESRSEANSTGGTLPAPTNLTVRLPRLNICKFNGDITAWQNFWSHFDSAFHQNQSLSKVDKFNYLKTLLEGTAASAIAGLMLTEDNYDAAVRILTERFGRKELLISAHVNKLLNLNPVKRANDMIGLRTFYDCCEIQIRSLEAAGVELQAYGNLLYPILIRLIPEEIVLEYNRRKGPGDDWNVSRLLDFLKTEIESRESTFLFNRVGNEEKPLEPFSNRQKLHKSNKENGGYQSQNRYHTAAALTTSTSDLHCIFCERSDHKSENCKSSIAERKEALKRKGKCFNCLRGKHLARFCRANVTCAKCDRRHDTLICDSREKKLTKTWQAETIVSSMTQDYNEENVVHLQTACALAAGKKGSLGLRCLLDGGSQRTFIREDISRKLQLEVIGEECLTIHSFGTEFPDKLKCRRVKLILRNCKDPQKSVEIQALESSKISSAMINVPGRKIEEYFSANELELSDSFSCNKHTDITVLIGADYYWRVVKGTIRRISETLVAMDTVFGWTVHGPTSSENICPVVVQSEVGVMNVCINNSFHSEEPISKTLRKFWELEALGILDSNDEKSQSDQKFIDDFESTLQFKESRYETRLPWRDTEKELPNNLSVACKRFQGLVKRFKSDPNFYFRYKEVIDNYLALGIAESVKEVDERTDGHKTYYMPHQAVIREDRPTSKLRVVFDASSHAHGSPSLNDCLHSGPNLSPDLFGLLVMFRQNPVAFVADIEQAFLQISLACEDRDAVRFLWIDGDLDHENSNSTQTLRMTRVLFGVTSSPFLLSATIKAHLKKYRDKFPEACSMLEESLYVDDVIGGSANDKEAFQISRDIKEIMGEAGMKMHKWHTNSKGLQEMWDEINNVSKIEVKPIGQKLSTQKVLGIAWQSITDKLTFEVSSLLSFLKNSKCSKRAILQATGRIFDPIGLVTPFTVRAKIGFQELWLRGVNWDDPLPEDIKLMWTAWIEELPLLSTISIPRYYYQSANGEQIESLELHCFTDASERAYGAVLYSRYSTKTGKIGSVLLSSKSRVAPIKKLSLPRLELMGALIGARLTDYVKKLLDNHIEFSTHFWSDSMIVLFWIRGTTAQLKPFVQNRVMEIQTKTEPCQWRHCPGQQNPADMLTRGVPLKKLGEDNLWWSGPDWLSRKESEWPEMQFETPCKENVKNETRKAFLVSTQASCITERPDGALLDIQKFSNLTKLLRITAWIFRFVYNARNVNNKKQGVLTASELAASENFWIRHIQRHSFSLEVGKLFKKRQIPNTSRIYVFKPFLDEEGILRVGGRLQNSEFSFDQKHPILLPSKDALSDLIIKRSHERISHGGVSQTLTDVRDRFWILKCRQQIKTIIHRCSLCKRFSARPFAQDEAPLPPERITEATAFEITGMDFAGPLYVQLKGRHEKSYILLFTCAVTRAVHLELVTDMSTDTLMQGFRRFISRRGVCSVIYSDNAKSFQKADKELKCIWKNLKKEKLQEYFGNSGITWKYIVPKAPWWGGFYERLVRSTKTCLKKILGKAYLKFQELQTVLTEIEAILNSRPLSFVYSDANEPSPLTPGHFLVGKRLVSLPCIRPKCIPNSTKEELSKRYKYRQSLLNRFWEKWKDSYILDLRSAHQSRSKKMGQEIKQDTIVLLRDEKLNRSLWKMGKITEVNFGRDNKVRSCSVRLSSGQTIKRPVQLLCPLELELERPN